MHVTYLDNTISVAVVEAPTVRLSESGSTVAGASYTLTCTVTLPSEVQLDDSFPLNIQWSWPDTIIIIPAETSQISSVYVSTIRLNPLQETHSGQYSCSASYSLGGISSEVVTEDTAITVICEYACISLYILIMPVLILSHAAAPGVSVRDEGSAVAGSDYSLFCEVTIPPFSGTTGISEPVVIWTRPSGNSDHLLFGNSVQLLFSPLTSDDDGVYTCTAHYLVNGISSPQGSDSHEISVSKSLCFYVLRYL